MRQRKLPPPSPLLEPPAMPGCPENYGSAYGCREHRGMLAHAEIVVRAPHRDLGADAVVIGARKPAAPPLQIGEHAVPPLGAQSVEAVFEVVFVMGATAALPRLPRSATPLIPRAARRKSTLFQWLAIPLWVPTGKDSVPTDSGA